MRLWGTEESAKRSEFQGCMPSAGLLQACCRPAACLLQVEGRMVHPLLVLVPVESMAVRDWQRWMWSFIILVWLAGEAIVLEQIMQEKRVEWFDKTMNAVSESWCQCIQWLQLDRQHNSVKRGNKVWFITTLCHHQQTQLLLFAIILFK
jgi:hypothetical protein